MKRWGGARAGAGRPAKHAIASEPHKTRPELRGRPVHVTARVVQAVASLTGHDAYRALHHALARSLSRGDFRIVQIAVRGRWLELVVEADHRIALARGMQGFEIAAARALNRACGRKGSVFADRYRPRELATRAAVRAVLDRLAPERARSDSDTRAPRPHVPAPRAGVQRSGPRIGAPFGWPTPAYASGTGPNRVGYRSVVWPRHALPQSWLLAAELVRFVARRMR